MKNKFLAIFLMICTCVSIFGVTFAVVKPNIQPDGPIAFEKEECTVHTLGAYEVTSNGSQHYKICSVCSKDYDYASHTAVGGWAKGDEQHWRKCGICSYGFNVANHSYSNWSDNGNGTCTGTCATCGKTKTSNHVNKKNWYGGQGGDLETDKHYADCANCGKMACFFAYCNGNEKVQLGENKDWHEAKCTVCGSAKLERHAWNGGEDEKHYCACGYIHSTYHYYQIGSKAELSYSCLMSDGNGCGHSISMQRPSTIYGGMPLDDYAASDAIVSIGDIPEFPDGQHWFSYSGKLRNAAGATSASAISSLGPGFWNESWGVIYIWNRHTVATHSGFGPSGLPPLPEELQTTDNVQEIRVDPKAFALNMDHHGLPVNVYWDDGVSVKAEEIETSNGGGVITPVMNAIAENRRSGWPAGPKAACMGVIKGSSFAPSCWSFDGQKFNVDYGEVAEDCGWLFDGSDGIFGEELYGNPGGGITKIYADVYYCYRTTDGEVPKNGYSSGLTLAGRYCVYEAGYKTVNVTLRPDMDKINTTGYRYVGAAANVGKIEDVFISARNQTTEPQITVTVSGRYTQSAAIVTFFVEPVKLSYGHKAVDYNENIIDINASSHQGEDLEFPDFYNAEEGKSIIPAASKFSEDEIEPLESLHKFYWPGYILTDAKVYRAGTDEIIYEKEYDFNTSTYIDFENPENSRYVINEQVPSYYENEKPGYAADKEFYFYYKTPLIDIIHKDFETGDTLVTNTGEEIKYITYLQQIINQYAYIESLITDDEKEEYTLAIRNLEGIVERFNYSYPRRDLVQIKIYEVEDGKSKLFATLYHNEEYNNGDRRSFNIDDIRFPDSYSDSLIAIVEKTGVSASDFNTNKNWKIEFIYNEVDDYVNIKYMKYRNELEPQPIYIPITNSDGSIEYKDEIKAEVPKDGYIHTPTNLDGDKLKLFKYTISEDDYVTSIDKGTNIASGTDVTVSGDSGDWYLIFFFASDMLTVEYRDISGDVPINVPPDNKSSISLEIPEYGMELEVPEVPAYKVRYYIKDDNYISGDVSGDIIYTQEKERIPIVTNGNNQYIIIYYEKIMETSELIIEYRKDTTTGDEIRPADRKELPIGEPTEVQIPEIASYKKKFYKVNSQEPVLIAETEISTVMMQGDPTLAQQKLICVYEIDGTTPPPDGDPAPIIPDTNTQVVRLRANSSTNEEYNVETAIPTSEDLYVTGDVYSYRFESEIEKVNKEETLKITVRQPYYTDLDNPDEIDYIQVTINDFLLEYGYYEIKKAELYDLKLLHLENEAIKYYDNYSYDNPAAEKYIEGQANFPVDADIFPYLEYNLPTGVDTDNDEARIQINSTAGYEVTKNSNKNYTITIRDVDYYRAVDVENLREQLEMEAKNIIEECTDIKVPTLKIRMNGDTTNSKVVSILMGNEYKLSERSDAMDSTVHYLPFTENRAPVEGFFFDKNLYVKESAQNQLYPSTMTGDYRMVAKILTSESTDIETYTPSGVALGSKTINVDSLNVHTPIVNKAIIEIDESNIQLNEEVRNALSGTTKILNVGETFAIQIPNVGNHLNANGYKNNKNYNFGGLMINGTETNNNSDVNMNYDSADNLMPLGIIVNTPSGAVIEQTKLAEYENEKNPKGPSFAEYKLIRFPFDVYLLNADLDGGKPVLFKANEWYNLYAYLKPSKIKYEFALPNWVEDATLYSVANGNPIHVLVVAENASLTQLEAAMQNPLGVVQAENNANVANKINMHIIRKTFDIYVSGRLYDLQIRDSDDPGYMNKITSGLSGNTSAAPFISNELALAQKDQVPGYNMGLKLGYRFYFDLKTRGISNKEVILTPKIYYVSLDGTTIKKPEEITLFYHSKGSLYNRLDTNDLNVRMTMTGTHGLAANNAGFTTETIAAKQINPSRIFTNQVIIGKLFSGITLKRDTEKLPYNNLEEVAKLCGFEGDVTGFLTSAFTSEFVESQNDIKNATGHWYGEYYLPASTLVVLGSNVPREQVIKGTYKPAPAGYLVVVFEEITTEDSVDSEDGYLTYSMPSENSQWLKEGIDSSITLPNGKTAQLTAQGAPMAIYQVNLRANNDYETEGTH